MALIENVTWPAVAAVLALVVALCSIASFYIGRQKASHEDGEEEGGLRTDIKYIKDTVRDQTKSIEHLSTKIDEQSQKNEQDYRDLLVRFTELKSSYKSLHIRVDTMEQTIKQYHFK